jgi:hypothetical protein
LLSCSRTPTTLPLTAAGAATGPHLAVVCCWLLPQLLHRQLHAVDNQRPEGVAAEERDVCCHVVRGLCCVVWQDSSQAAATWSARQHRSCSLTHQHLLGGADESLQLLTD